MADTATDNLSGPRAPVASATQARTPPDSKRGNCIIGLKRPREEESTGNPSATQGSAPSDDQPLAKKPAVHATVDRETVEIDEPVGDEALDGASIWSANPSREKILRLANIADAKLGQYPPAPTAREVMMNAMASVELLEDPGIFPANTSDVGINHVGRLCRIGPSDKDFREDFSDLVRNIRTELEKERRARLARKAREVHERIKLRMKEFLTTSAELNGPDSRVSYDSLPAVEGLRSYLNNAAQKSRLFIFLVLNCLPRCQEAAEEVIQIISTVDAVVQDLTRNGSTSPERRSSIMAMSWFHSMDDGELERMFQNDPHELSIAMTLYLIPYRRLLKEIVRFADDLRMLKKERASRFQPRCWTRNAVKHRA